MIRLDRVSFSYMTAGGSIRAVDSLDLELRPGEVLVVAGENGSGKSTLARLINGLLLPDEGTVTVDGLSTAHSESVWDIRRRVGMVFQNPDNQIVATFCEEDVAFGPENLGVSREELRERVDRSLALVGLQGFERREPHLLSGGQKQRLAIAGALAMHPDYLVLDEPTAMLDPQGREDVLGILGSLRSEGRGIIHITHDLTDAAQADRVLVLRDGRSAFLGSPETLLGDPDMQRSLGLTVPPVIELGAALRARGVGLAAGTVSPEALVDSLWA